ncbi:MAG: copper chaperone PCu(A)C [Pseudomonadota bacterium]
MRTSVLLASACLILGACEVSDDVIEGARDGYTETGKASGQEQIGFIRLPAEGAGMSAAYLTLVLDRDDRVVSASIEGVSNVELHTVIDDNGINRMRKVEGYDVKAGEPLVLQPGGNHLMLFGLYEPMTDGEKREVTLVFESGATETLRLPISRTGSAMSGHGNH